MNTGETEDCAQRVNALFAEYHNWYQSSLVKEHLITMLDSYALSSEKVTPF